MESPATPGAPRPDSPQPGQTATNATSAVAQVVVSGLLFLLLYRYLLGSIGASNLGVWSLVLASTNVSRLGGFGLQGSAVRYVARYLARGERATAARVVETSVLATAGVIAVAAALAYPLIGLLLGRLLEPGARAVALEILPYAFGSLWLNAVTLVVQSALDGCQRADLRSSATVYANALYVAAAMAAVPALGLVGLALAQLAQSAVLLGWTWQRLRRVLPELPAVPLRWSYGLFREMLRYGANVQAETVFWMLHDPLAKILLSHFGSLAAVGYFEMAARLVQQVRALMTAGFQVLIPVIANYHETAPARVREVYASAAQLLIYVAVPAFGALIVGAPLIGRAWIGHGEPDFVVFLDLLSVAALANALAAPAMNANFGTGHIGWHTIAAILMAVLNVALGIPAGWAFGGRGVVIAWVAAMVAGSALIAVTYHHRTGTPGRALVSRASAGVLAATAGSIALASLAALYRVPGRPGAIAPLLVAPACYAVLMAAPLWLHVARRRLVRVVLERLPHRRLPFLR